MVRRTPVYRVLALSFALLFATAQVGRAHAHACQTRDSAPAAAGHGHQHGQHGQDEGSECHCIGACCVSAGLIAVPVLPALPAGLLQDDADAAPQVAADPVTSSQLRIPFANGPPRHHP